MSVSAEQHGDALTVECATDIHESGFRDLRDDAFMASAWNLRRVPTAAGSCLVHTPGAAATPSMALGMLFSTSNWHVQDANLWALSYLHAGGSKSWYSVAAPHAEAFETAMQDLVRARPRPATSARRHAGKGPWPCCKVPALCVIQRSRGRAVSCSAQRGARAQVYSAAVAKMRAEGASADEIRGDVLRTIARRSTACCPADLVAAGVPVAHCVQRPGEFVVTGARVHSCTLSHAANVSEVARFAPRSWLEFGADAMLRCAVLNMPPVRRLDLACACARRACCRKRSCQSGDERAC